MSMVISLLSITITVTAPTAQIIKTLGVHKELVQTFFVEPDELCHFRLPFASTAAFLRAQLEPWPFVQSRAHRHGNNACRRSHLNFSSPSRHDETFGRINRPNRKDVQSVDMNLISTRACEHN